MKQFLHLSLFTTLFVLLVGSPVLTWSQTKTVQVKKVKELPDAFEYEIVWEGEDYKTTYYEVKAILESYAPVQKQVFLWKIRRISAVVSKEKDTVDLLNLFRSHGFDALEKASPPGVPSAN